MPAFAPCHPYLEVCIFCVIKGLCVDMMSPSVYFDQTGMYVKN